LSTANELGRGPLLMGSVVGCILAGDLTGEVRRGAIHQLIQRGTYGMEEEAYMDYRHSYANRAYASRRLERQLPMSQLPYLPLPPSRDVPSYKRIAGPAPGYQYSFLKQARD